LNKINLVLFLKLKTLIMAQGVHKITEDFEKALCDYTGAPHAIALDNMSNALFLALYYEKNVKKTLTGDTVDCPSKTYPSVPCEIIHAGLKVNFTPVEGKTIKGAYTLSPSNVIDSALRFTSDMYVSGTHMCLSFTGPYKTLKLSKGGAIRLCCGLNELDLAEGENVHIMMTTSIC
jgi:hypothetical protein